LQAEIRNPMSKLMTLWKYIRRHKYLITVLAFLVIIVFLDENSLIQRAQHRQEINDLTTEIEKYRKQYEEDTERLKELTTNPEALEKIAREKYFMKKPNEDIFIFEE
jgi:cell division protein FtsB